MFILRYLCLSICIVQALLVLTSCTSNQKKSMPDGPPVHVPEYIDKIPNAVPRPEPLSKYGNRFKNSNTYVAKRKRYKVMPTSRGYRAEGKASWYGTKFQGRRTSSGERYNMFAMTAAHRTLPLPTYAKVTNLDNGKSVIVKINDRGPFHGNRLIDLSYVAAHKLGILGKGTGRVEVASIDPRDNRSHNKKSSLKEKASVKLLASKEETPKISNTNPANLKLIPSKATEISQLKAKASELKSSSLSKVDPLTEDLLATNPASQAKKKIRYFYN